MKEGILFLCVMVNSESHDWNGNVDFFKLTQINGTKCLSAFKENFLSR